MSNLLPNIDENIAEKSLCFFFLNKCYCIVETVEVVCV